MSKMEMICREDSVKVACVERNRAHTFSLTPASLKNFSSFSSRSVRKQNMECSKGEMRLMATLRCVGMWIAELWVGVE